MESLADAELMARVRSGDRGAFAKLVDRHKDPLVNYLVRMTRCRDRAEEFAQEAFLRLYQAAPRYSEQGRLVPYLYRIATNLVRSEERRKRRWYLFSVAFSSNGNRPAPNPQSQLLRAEIKEKVSEALRTVPTLYRAPLVLRDIEGWSYRDIAKVLGCREGTVKSRINRGRSQLRERLEPYVKPR
jgi:RNA polymerase sigma-70 factor (ECF subfamily)